jgi:hypothetical protein
MQKNTGFNNTGLYRIFPKQDNTGLHAFQITVKNAGLNIRIAIQKKA